MTLPAPEACALGIRDETLSVWRDGLMPAEEAQRLEAHVAGCAACGARLEAFDAVRRTLLTQRMPDVQEQVWRALQPHLVSEKRLRVMKRRGQLAGGMAALAAALIVALLIGVLFATRGSTGGPTRDATATAAQSPTIGPTATAPATATATATATHVPFSAQIAVHSAQIDLQGRESTSASCAPGEQLLGGGYVTNSALTLPFASYPSASATWTVTAQPPSPDSTVTLTAYVVCLHGNFSVSAVVVSHSQVVPNNTPTTVSASCPPGSVLTGGGFASTFGSWGSFPAGTAWSATYDTNEGVSFSAQVYAVCAQANLSAAGQPTQTVSAPPYHNIAPTIACGGTSLLTSGGYQTPAGAAVVAGSSPTDATATSWTVLLSDSNGASISAQIWAVCVAY